MILETKNHQIGDLFFEKNQNYPIDEISPLKFSMMGGLLNESCLLPKIGEWVGCLKTLIK